jgi:DoxX-like family
MEARGLDGRHRDAERASNRAVPAPHARLGLGDRMSPGLPRLKEWAYAGVVFDLSGAAASHAFVGDPPGKVAVPLVLLTFAALSWALRPATRRMGEVLPGALVPPPSVRTHAA